jgi:hypothetical protein
MSYIIRLVAAFGLGVYSTIGLHYYSVWIARSKSEWLRLACMIPVVGLFIFAPMVGCMFVLGWGPVPNTHAMRLVWIGMVFLAWIGTVWVYIIKNWRVLEARLRPGQFSITPK